MKNRLTALLLAAAGLACAGSMFAQTPAPQLRFPAASPAGSIKQRIGLTDLEITYNRPSAKGRKIFGGLVPYGEVWRTGADTATRLTLSTAAKIGGADVAAGTYELFTLPGEAEWTVILQKAQEKPQWGAYAYDAKNDSARFTVKPAPAPAFVESLSFQIGQLTQSSAVLTLAWENTSLAIPVAVDTVGLLAPQIEAAMAGNSDKKPYFQAAMFYYDNNLDLKKALAWMDAGLATDPNAFWMIYRKGLLLAKAGDKAAAKAAAEQSLAMAEKDQRASIRDEYVRLNQALLESLK